MTRWKRMKMKMVKHQPPLESTLWGLITFNLIGSLVCLGGETPTLDCWNGHKRSFMWLAYPTQTKQAIQMCELDRARTKGVPTPAVKDVMQMNLVMSRRVPGCTASLVCWGVWHLTQYPKHGTLARARGVARYFVHKPRLARTFLVGKTPHFRDVFGDSC